MIPNGVNLLDVGAEGVLNNGKPCQICNIFLVKTVKLSVKQVLWYGFHFINELLIILCLPFVPKNHCYAAFSKLSRSFSKNNLDTCMHGPLCVFLKLSDSISKNKR